MSLTKNKQLAFIATEFARELRKRSTEAERMLWEVVRNRNLSGKKFLRQHPLFYDCMGKESFFIADFFCHELNLVIELDGEIHKYRLSEDKFRTEILNSLGLQVIRFGNNEIINNIEKVKEEILKFM